MKINMNNQAILNILETLNKFGDVTGVLAMAIKKTKSNLETDMRIYLEERDKIFKKYNYLYDENGKIKDSDNMEELNKLVEEITDLANFVSEVEIVQVDEEVFKKADIYNEQCSVRDYDLLEMIMVEGRLKPAPSEEENETEEEKEEEPDNDEGEEETETEEEE